MQLSFFFVFFVFSLGQDLLTCILEIMDMPEVAKESVISVVNEDDFRRILDWCDIWIILLKTTGKSVYVS